MKGLNHPNIGEEGKGSGLSGYQPGLLGKESRGRENWLLQ